MPSHCGVPDIQLTANGDGTEALRCGVLRPIGSGLDCRLLRVLTVQVGEHQVEVGRNDTQVMHDETLQTDASTLSASCCGVPHLLDQHHTT